VTAAAQRRGFSCAGSAAAHPTFSPPDA